MPKPPERSRRPTDPMKAAEALFRPQAPKAPEPAKTAALPGVKESVTLRIDQDILDFFREDGPGWQDRLNAALRRVVDDGRR
jgi:uncharacterized protein (DUF4415 family)